MPFVIRVILENHRGGTRENWFIARILQPIQQFTTLTHFSISHKYHTNLISPNYQARPNYCIGAFVIPFLPQFLASENLTLLSNIFHLYIAFHSRSPSPVLWDTRFQLHIKIKGDLCGGDGLHVSGNYI